MKDAKFIASAVGEENFPEGDRPEIALVGRSNAGKSSLLNAMVGKKNLARVSQTPGRTRVINFFDVGTTYRLVDLPGYGFAVGDRQEVQNWKSMIELYFRTRGNLTGFVLIADIRRDWKEDEAMLKDWADQAQIPFALALSKSDKLSHSEVLPAQRRWTKASGLPPEFVIPVSSLKLKGVKELEELIFRNWVETP